MGEAKAKRNRLKASPCRCRSKRVAADCCFGGAYWHKPPAHLGLRMLPPEASHDRCYMRELHNCEGSISGEHLISETVIEVLRGEGDFTVSGLAWQEAGEEKRLAPGNLTANCLCRRHNSAVSARQRGRFVLLRIAGVYGGEDCTHALLVFRPRHRTMVAQNLEGDGRLAQSCSWPHQTSRVVPARHRRNRTSRRSQCLVVSNRDLLHHARWSTFR
ncbi:hypothetical protein ACVME8_000285 [Bradyrhizobium diazoefficiens]